MEAKKGHLIRLGEVITKLKSDNEKLLQENEEMKAMLEKIAKIDEFDICDFIEIEQLLTKINQ